MSLDLSHSLGVSKHADLKTRAGGSILVLPERAIRLGGSGAEILRLVAENRRIESILSTMLDRYPDSPDSPTLASEVLDFLEEMLGLGAIVFLDECSEEKS